MRCILEEQCYVTYILVTYNMITRSYKCNNFYSILTKTKKALLLFLLLLEKQRKLFINLVRRFDVQRIYKNSTEHIPDYALP